MQVRRVYNPLDLRKKHGKNERGLRNFTQISTGTMNYIGLDNLPHADVAEGFVEICSEASYPRTMRGPTHCGHAAFDSSALVVSHSRCRAKPCSSWKQCGEGICEEV